MGERALDILCGLGALPAVPFHEGGPARYIEAALQRLPVDVHRDSYGNIIAHYAKRADAGRRPIAFVAHMDHPGFETIEAAGDGVVARALGGVPAASLTRPTPVLVLPEGSEPVQAETRPFDGPTPEGSSDRLVTIQLRQPARIAPSTPVVFDLPGFELDGGTIRMRALDDLAGCAAILASGEAGRGRGRHGPVRRLHQGRGGRIVRSAPGRLGRDAAEGDGSRLGGVQPGHPRRGPGRRAGGPHRRRPHHLRRPGRAAAPGRGLPAEGARPRLQVPAPADERRRLRGHGLRGAGYSVTGIAFPLGSYHNATTRIADPESGVGPEYIELSDFLGGVDLIAEAARGGTAGGGPPPSPRALPHVPDEVRDRLQATSQA